MDGRLTARLLCSTGLAFFCRGETALVDVLNGSWGSFYRLPRETARAVIDGEPPYGRVSALLYTHLHPDHYDQQDNQAFLDRHPGVTTFFPTAATADQGRLTAGPFQVEYRYLEHAPWDGPWTKHYVLLLSAGGTTVYLAADGRLAPEEHLAVLGGRVADYGFFNAMYLSRPETRRLMGQCARRVFIYHMPPAATDRSGICRKAALNFQRYPEELQRVTLLDGYPRELALPPLERTAAPGGTAVPPGGMGLTGPGPDS